MRETYWRVTARKLDDNINNESSSTPDLQEEVVSLKLNNETHKDTIKELKEELDTLRQENENKQQMTKFYFMMKTK